MDQIREFFGIAGFALEAVGVIVMIIGFFGSTTWYIARLRRKENLSVYQAYRRDLARSIILGLEFLIAGDIIRTVTVDQTLQAAAVLAVIVFIRITLSLMLEFDVEGRWPWQRAQPPDQRN
jgi:uncharacterized membrane protein